MNTVAHPLQSPQWHRLAGLRPALPAEVSISRSWVRGQRWYVLHQWRQQQTCRLNDAAYAVAARLDGQRTVQEIWQSLEHMSTLGHGSQGHQEPPSQDDIIGVLSQLSQHGMIQLDVAAPTAPGDETSAPSSSALRKSILAWRMPLGNPQNWLSRHAAWAHRIFSGTGLVLWSLCMLALLTGLILHHQALSAHASAWMHTPRYLCLSLLAYPLIKWLHELGHALAINRWGGTVREVGVTWMMFMPVPYVNASAAHGFAHAWQRAWVAAAGIQCELTLATAGLWLWQWTEPGLLHDTGYVVWFTGCASTLLFNANPLQRLDGYHVLTEWLHLPNLALRSSMGWQHRIRNWLSTASTPVHSIELAPPAPGEPVWLALHAPLAWLYQVALWSGMCWWIGEHSAVLAALLAVACLSMLALKPLFGLGYWAWQHTLVQEQHVQSWWRTAAGRFVIGGTLGLAMLVMPWPDQLMMQGIVWAPEEAIVRSDVEGLVVGIHARDGQRVRAGQLLLTLHNPQLQARREQVAAKLAQAEQTQYAHLGTESAKAGQADQDVNRLSAELDELDQQLSRLQVRAHQDGRLVWPRADDLDGLYAKRGQLLGQVLGAAPPSIKIAVPQADVPLWHRTSQVHAMGRVSMRLQHPGAAAVPAASWRDAMGATQVLPSAALSRDLGGEIATDPSDAQHLRTLRPVVLMDFLPAQPLTDVQDMRLGQRAWVKLDQGWAPPLWQWWRWVRHRALQDLAPAS